MKRKARPAVKVTAGRKVPRHQWPNDSTLIHISEGDDGCQIEVSKQPGGGLCVRLYAPIGNVHLCAPSERLPFGQCIWSQSMGSDGPKIFSPS